MRAEGLEIAIGTSAQNKDLKPLLELADVEDLIDSKTSSDDALRSKPDPDIIQAALSRLKLPAAEVLMVGDTPYDIEAAGRAGVRTVAFRSGGWTDGGLKGARPRPSPRPVESARTMWSGRAAMALPQPASRIPGHPPRRC